MDVQLKTITRLSSNTELVKCHWGSGDNAAHALLYVIK